MAFVIYNRKAWMVFKRKRISAHYRQTNEAVSHNINIKIFLRQKWAVMVVMAVFFAFFYTCSDNRPKNIRIGIVSPHPIHAQVIDAFQKEMTAMCNVRGKKVTYIFNSDLNENQNSIDKEINKLLSQDVDILVTVGHLATIRAKQAVAGTDIPVVFGAVSNPVGLGIVKEISHPGGNFTGVQVGTEVVRAIELLTEIVPNASKVYLPYNPDDTFSKAYLDSVASVERRLNIEIVYGKVHSVEEAVAAIRHLPSDINAIFRIPSPTLDHESDYLNKTAIDLKLPVGACYSSCESALFTLGVDLSDVGKRAARLAIQVVSGIKTANLPVETPDFFFIINLETADKIGLEVPEITLLQANRVIR